MHRCHMTVSDLPCECTHEQGTNHNLWFWRGSSVQLVPLIQTESLKLNMMIFIAERARKKTGIQLRFKASETDRQCHQNIFKDLANKKGDYILPGRT